MNGKPSFVASSYFPSFVYLWCMILPSSLTMYVARTKVNFRLNTGQFRIDLSDGEVIFHSTVPLEGMTLGDCIPLLQSW